MPFRADRQPFCSTDVDRRRVDAGKVDADHETITVTVGDATVDGAIVDVATTVDLHDTEDRYDDSGLTVYSE